MPTTLISAPGLPKIPVESRKYTMPFDSIPEIRDLGLSIQGVSVTVDTTGLSLGTPVISGSDVILQIGGGVDGSDYYLTFVATLSDGSTPAAVGPVFVRAK